MTAENIHLIDNAILFSYATGMHFSLTEVELNTH